ncbi:uncharacterized protein FMAN_06925 [Fusarium mangiferae]|uniref:BZIP domain-containing protein n=1 Tax=Fusarium mangiferae TaxID=192010 RepID=A0A1L7TAJ5_FUSMA|nr:uncharacterized protein FMAN_06925 [Fusarium mangiferae]CVK91816.1 uncharacterized protein FMAN_06925 [Fusarium mangiferae]
MTHYQEPRRGRPRLQGQDDARDRDDAENKRMRMRLAQRTYRARKEDALNLEKARSERLSGALDQALAAFATLHQRVLEFPEVHGSSGLLAHLNHAASEMATIASDTNKTARLLSASESTYPNIQQPAPGTTSLSSTAAAGELQNDWILGLEPTTAHMPALALTGSSDGVALTLRTNNQALGSLSDRIIRACLERVITILSSSSRHASRFLDLTLPLNILGKELLVDETLKILPLFHHSDYQYLPESAVHLPSLYRVVEGDKNVVRRLPSPSVQRILRGKTRTLLATDFPPLQGEWLEAIDVEEYLEDRGIYLRGVNLSDMASLEEFESQIFTHNNDLQNGRSLTSTNSLISAVPDQIQVTSRTSDFQQPLSQTGDSSVDLRRHEPADYSVFGLPSPEQSISPAEPLPLLRTGLIPIQSPRVPCTSSTEQSYHPASQITIDLDKLIHLLASNAICLGPAPGIRKAAVDSSIAQSVISS